MNTLSGRIIPYEGNGRKIGYPTANITVDNDEPSGIFIATATVDEQTHPALAFIGVPTTLDQPAKRAEAHILDFPDQDLYGKEMEIALIKKIRDNEKFDDINELVAAIAGDERITRQYFDEHQIINKP